MNIAIAGIGYVGLSNGVLLTQHNKEKDYTRCLLGIKGIDWSLIKMI